MATRRPIVLVSGVQSELPVGDNIDGALYQGQQVVAGSGLVGGGLFTTDPRIDVALATNPSGLYFTGDNKLGFDGQANSVQFVANGSGAVDRTVESKLLDSVSVLDFIPAGTDTATVDCTSYIQAALTASNIVIVPDGTFALSGTLVLSSGKSLRIDGTLTRLGASTDPLIRFNGQHSEVYGVGSLITSNNSPNGIVLFGTLTPNVSTGQANILWNKFEGVRLSGFNTVGSGSCGIRFNSEEGYGVSSQANYFNWVSNVAIAQVDYGVYLTGECNGQVLHGLQMYRIGVNCVTLDGSVGVGATVTDCLVSNITVHSSGSLQNILYVNQSNRNSFSNIGGEPGSGRLFNFTASGTANFFSGYDNCPNSPINNGVTNVIARNGNLYANLITSPKVDATEILGDKLLANTTGSSSDPDAVIVSTGRSELDKTTRFRRTSSGASDMSFTISFANPGSGFYYPFAVEIFVAYTGNSVPRGAALVFVSGQIFNGNVGAVTSVVQDGGGTSISSPVTATSGLDLTITLDTFSSSTHRGVADVRVISWAGITAVT